MRSVAAVLLLASSAATATPTREPPVWIALEGLYGSPDVADARPAGGGGLRIGYRFTDQLSSAAGFETLYLRGGAVIGLAAGFEAMLDITPIAPFLELSVMRLDPVSLAGFSLAQRTGFGADWRVSRALSVGAVVRYLSPLDADPGNPGIAKITLGLRLVVVPGAF